MGFTVNHIPSFQSFHQGPSSDVQGSAQSPEAQAAKPLKPELGRALLSATASFVGLKARLVLLEALSRALKPWLSMGHVIRYL
jgi:hypothetical protein